MGRKIKSFAVSISNAEAAEGGRLPSHTTHPNGTERLRRKRMHLIVILKKKKLINNTLENQKIIVQEDIASQSEHDKTSQIDRSFDRVWAMYGNPVGNKT